MASACSNAGKEDPGSSDAGVPNGDASLVLDAHVPDDAASLGDGGTLRPFDDSRNDPRFARVLDLLEEDLATTGAPGASIAVIEHGHLAFAAGVGHTRWGGTEPVGPDTLYQVGSLSKPLTAAMVMSLVEDGTVDLNAPVTRYTSAFGVGAPYDAASVTLHHLLSHTAGYPNAFPEGRVRTCDPLGAEGLVRAFERLSDVPLWFGPGTMWNYSNNGYSVVALVTQEATDTYYVDLMERRVFAPLAMTSTTFDGAEVTRGDYAVGHELRGAGRPTTISPTSFDCAFDHPQSTTLWSTAVDLARFGEALLNGGGGALRPESVLAMTTAVATETDSVEAGYGYGLFVDRYKGFDVWQHGGSTRGFQSMLWLVPSRGFGVAVVVNASHSPLLATWRATDVFLGLPEENPPRAETRPFAEWSRYVGEYADATGELGDVSVELVGGRLFATNATIGGRVEIGSYARDQFVPLTGPWMFALTVQFSFDPGIDAAQRIGSRVGVATRRRE